MKKLFACKSNANIWGHKCNIFMLIPSRPVAFLGLILFISRVTCSSHSGVKKMNLQLEGAGGGGGGGGGGGVGI